VVKELRSIKLQAFFFTFAFMGHTVMFVGGLFLSCSWCMFHWDKIHKLHC